MRKDKDILDQKYKVACQKSAYKANFECNEKGECIHVTNDKNILFYFDNDGMTHAARFVHSINNTIIDAWISKLGQDIAITHMPGDLNSTVYGEPLCIAYT